MKKLKEMRRRDQKDFQDTKPPTSKEHCDDFMLL